MRGEDEESIKSRRTSQNAQDCRTRVGAKFKPVAPGGERVSPTSGSTPANQNSVHKIQRCGVFKISPSLESTLFLFSVALGRIFHRPTTFIRQPIFQRTVDDTDLQDACDVCLNPSMRLASSYDVCQLPLLPFHRLVHGASFADCRRPLLLGKLLLCVSHDTRSEQLQPARSFLRFSLFPTGLRHSLWTERCPAGCWS